MFEGWERFLLAEGVERDANHKSHYGGGDVLE